MAEIQLKECTWSYRCPCGYDVFANGSTCVRCGSKEATLQPQTYWILFMKRPTPISVRIRGVAYRSKVLW